MMSPNSFVSFENGLNKAVACLLRENVWNSIVNAARKINNLTLLASFYYISALLVTKVIVPFFHLVIFEEEILWTCFPLMYIDEGFGIKLMPAYCFFIASPLLSVFSWLYQLLLGETLFRGFASSLLECMAWFGVTIVCYERRDWKTR